MNRVGPADTIGLGNMTLACMPRSPRLQLFLVLSTRYLCIQSPSTRSKGHLLAAEEPKRITAHTDLLTTTTTPDGGFRSSIVDRSNPLLIRTVHSSKSFGSLALILLAFALLVTPPTHLHTPTYSLNSSCGPSGRIVPRSRRLRPRPGENSDRPAISTTLHDAVVQRIISKPLANPVDCPCVRQRRLADRH